MMRDETFLIDYSKSKTDDMISPETVFILEQKKKNFSGTVRSAKMILTHCAPSSRCSRLGRDRPAVLWVIRSWVAVVFPPWVSESLGTGMENMYGRYSSLGNGSS